MIRASRVRMIRIMTLPTISPRERAMWFSCFFALRRERLVMAGFAFIVRFPLSYMMPLSGSTFLAIQLVVSTSTRPIADLNRPAAVAMENLASSMPTR